MDTDDGSQPNPARSRSLVLTIARQIYIQFAAVTGALSLAALFSHIFAWQGVLLDMVQWWAANVRPLVDFIYAPVLALLKSIFKIPIHLPIILKDYLAVGMVLILSRWRGAMGGWKGGARQAAGNLRRRPKGAITLLLRTLFVWPLEIIVLAQNMFFARRRFPQRSAEDVAQIRISHMIALLPVFYAIALVLLNWLLALFPTLITRQNSRSTSQ